MWEDMGPEVQLAIKGEEGSNAKSKAFRTLGGYGYTTVIVTGREI